MSIRTTLTLDEDVVERLKQESRSRGIPFRQAVNEILRSGLAAEQSAQFLRRVPAIEAKHMGTMPAIDYNNIESLLEIGEGEAHR
jgi:hypothetical protein